MSRVENVKIFKREKESFWRFWWAFRVIKANTDLLCLVAYSNMVCQYEKLRKHYYGHLPILGPCTTLEASRMILSNLYYSKIGSTLSYDFAKLEE